MTFFHPILFVTICTILASGLLHIFFTSFGKERPITVPKTLYIV